VITKLLQISHVSDNVRIAVALRAARTAIGWNQQEFADRMGVAKSSIARIETLEIAPKAAFLTKALRLLKEAGVAIELFQAEVISLVIEPSALIEAARRLGDDALRRTDRDATRRKSAAYSRRLMGETSAEETERREVAAAEQLHQPSKKTPAH
jgi:transcriptional regulator with XRE-family HTH domain